LRILFAAYYQSAPVEGNYPQAPSTSFKAALRCDQRHAVGRLRFGVPKLGTISPSLRAPVKGDSISIASTPVALCLPVQGRWLKPHSLRDCVQGSEDPCSLRAPVPSDLLLSDLLLTQKCKPRGLCEHLRIQKGLALLSWLLPREDWAIPGP